MKQPNTAKKAWVSPRITVLAAGLEINSYASPNRPS